MVAQRNAVVCLPGILAHSAIAHRPLWLERFFDKVEYFDYDENNFDAQLELRRARRKVESLHEEDYHVTILGSSLGGNLAAFVVDELAKSHNDLANWLDVVVVDAPSGLRTFKAVPGWISTGLITTPVGTGIFGLIGRVMITVNSMGVGLPKDELITRPTPASMKHMSGRNSFSNKEWSDWVKAEAKRGLSGHSSRVWRQQIQWMTQIEQNGSLDRAARSLRDLVVVYIQCTVGNDVVAQPAAQQWWLDRMGQVSPDRSARWLTVKAPHAAYLQMQPEFEAVIVQLFS